MPDLEDLLQGDQLKKARLQDAVIKIIFNTVQDGVFHGGTAIWRCFGGKRFSKDIDIYIAKGSSIRRVLNRLSQSGFDVKKDSQRRSTLFYTIKNSTDVSLQINKVAINGEIFPYVEADGTMMDVYSLAPEALIYEKIAAYKDRRLERDLYDIKILTASTVDKAKIAHKLKDFLSGIERPKDRGALKNLIYEGLVPTFDELVTYLERWCN
jgi:predicted nucleotidyltransferase component of viral defense system